MELLASLSSLGQGTTGMFLFTNTAFSNTKPPYSKSTFFYRGGSCSVNWMGKQLAPYLEFLWIRNMGYLGPFVLITSFRKNISQTMILSIIFSILLNVPGTVIHLYSFTIALWSVYHYDPSISQMREPAGEEINLAMVTKLFRCKDSASLFSLPALSSTRLYCLGVVRQSVYLLEWH